MCVRRGQRIFWQMPEKVYIPCGYGMKAAWAEASRMRGASQAELGLAALTFALSNPAGLDLTLEMMRSQAASLAAA